MKIRILFQSMFAVLLAGAVSCPNVSAVVVPSTTEYEEARADQASFSNEYFRLENINQELRKIAVQIKEGNSQSAAERLDALQHELEDINHRLIPRQPKSLGTQAGELLLAIWAWFLSLLNR